MEVNEQEWYRVCRIANCVTWATQRLDILIQLLDPNEVHVGEVSKEYIMKELVKIRDSIGESQKDITERKK